MALPQLNGVATLFAPGDDGFEAKFTKNGDTFTNVNVAFQKRVKDDYDEWETVGKLNIRATAWREVADNIIENFESGSSGVPVLLDQVEFVTFEKKDGGEGYSIQANLVAVGAPRKYDN